jgi:hypothetical protein
VVSHYLSEEIGLLIVAALCHLDAQERKQSENRESKLVGFIGKLEIGLYLFGEIQILKSMIFRGNLADFRV